MNEMDIKEYEHQYSPSRWSHRLGQEAVIDAHVEVMKRGSQIARETIECQTDLSYGLREKAKLDLFGAQTLPEDAPIFVYIHGGYWQFLGRESSSFMVTPLAKAGAVVVTIGYTIAPEASMDEIVSEVKAAITYVLQLAKKRGSSGVYLCGHSAGAHLAAMMLAVDWMGEQMLNDSLIKGALLVSGVYDISPLVNTYVNDPLRMTESDACRLSPVTHLKNIIQHSMKRRIVVAVGQHDSPAFHIQSKEFDEELRRGGVTSELIDVPDTDHFDVIEKMSEEEYILTEAAVKMMGLNLDGVSEGFKQASLIVNCYCCSERHTYGILYSLKMDEFKLGHIPLPGGETVSAQTPA
ncbi:hypothetical protein ScPMuIL_013059 [Solemya velum]